MVSQDDFREALKTGNLSEAFHIAVQKAARLNITTWVASSDDSASQETTVTAKPGYRLQTHIDFIEGKIENEIGEAVVDSNAYQALQEFHFQQIANSNELIQQNLENLEKLFQLLDTCKGETLDIDYEKVFAAPLEADKLVTETTKVAAIADQEQEVDIALISVAETYIPKPIIDAKNPIIPPQEITDFSVTEAQEIDVNNYAEPEKIDRDIGEYLEIEDKLEPINVDRTIISEPESVQYVKPEKVDDLVQETLEVTSENNLIKPLELEEEVKTVSSEPETPALVSLDDWGDWLEEEVSQEQLGSSWEPTIEPLSEAAPELAKFAEDDENIPQLTDRDEVVTADLFPQLATDDTNLKAPELEADDDSWPELSDSEVEPPLKPLYGDSLPSSQIDEWNLDDDEEFFADWEASLKEAEEKLNDEG